MLQCMVLNEPGKIVFGLPSKQMLIKFIACVGAPAECEEYRDI